MLIKFTLDTKPFSINQAYCRDMRYKTSAFKAWETALARFLHDVPELKTLGAEWNKRGGYFSIRINFVHPPGTLYTEAGAFSSRSFDISNCEKGLIDGIFRHMGVNDKHLQRMLSQKVPGTGWQIQVALKLYR